MKKRKPKPMQASPEVVSLFGSSWQMQLNADLYMSRCRELSLAAWDQFKRDHPEVDKNAKLKYKDGVVVLDEE